MDTAEFLQRVITTPEGYLELCLRSSSGIWHNDFYEWPTKLPEVCDIAQRSASEYDVYFSSHLFSERDSHKEYVLPSRTIQQDLDAADISTLPLTPSILTSTSPDRHQGFWLLDTVYDPELTELVSRRMAYSIVGCDHSGWPLGHKFRLPDTYNHKYLDGPHPVKIVKVTNKRYTLEELELLPDIDSITLERLDEHFIDTATSIELEVGPNELLESIKDSINAKAYADYNIQSDDRSKALWVLLTQAFKAGLSRQEVFWLAKHSANNKFLLLKYHADRELAKDVLRAELAVKTQSQDLRGVINEIRKQSKTLINERRRLIFDLVLSDMKSAGEFIKTTDGRRFYIARDLGRPTVVDTYSDYLSSYLDVKYGLNKSEPEHSYTVNSLISYASGLPENGTVAVLTYYDPSMHSLLIHTGRKQVYEIHADQINEVVDGAYNILFPWSYLIEPFTPNFNSDIDWGHVLFGDINNVLNITPIEAKYLLKVWLVFVLFRNAASSKPLLAFFGQPGSTKTTQTKKIFAFLYGKHVEISGLTDPEDFDMATATMPLFVLDNLDTWEKWLPDRLAQAAGNTDIVVRKHYSNTEVIRLKRQAVIVLSAHDPKFGRVDVADRMLILTLSRLSEFSAERPIIDNILSNRNKLWGALLKDVQKVLANDIPTHTDLQLRVEDFARIGEWISIGLGCQEEFRSAVTKLRGSQREFNLDEDHTLVQALSVWLTKTKGGVKTQDQLFNELMTVAPDQQTFLHKYKNSTILAKRLSTLQDTLNNTTCNISFSLGKGGAKIWNITSGS